MKYEVQVDGEVITYGPLVKRSRFSEKQWSAINHEMVKSNFKEAYEKYKDDEFIITVIADRIDLFERYEALLELLPQSTYSKAGTHPEWVAEAIGHNVFNKGITQDDVRMLCGLAEDKGELVALLTDYFDLEEEDAV